MAKINSKLLEERRLTELANEVVNDFQKRREERKSFEEQWKLNLNYLAGNQYCEISPTGEVREENKYYGWQSRSVFNHISPIIDTRLAKLARVRPKMSVRSFGSEEEDLKTAQISTDILNSTYGRKEIDSIISKATRWSETCGSAFYKVTWDNNLGKKIGSKDGINVYEGDVKIDAIPPFEIFPDNLYCSEISELKSIIHARAMSVFEVFEKYGEKLNGENIDVFTLSSSGASYNGGYKEKKVSSALENHVLVIERYERESREYPNGRFVVVGGGKVLYEGDLPYKNGEEGARDFPFIKQNSLSLAGSFFGVSLIERLIPLQRAYNAVKNRKYEFMNRISMGVINVEDGSIDADELIEDGLSPGKVIVYRQGSRPPQMMSTGSVPIDFSYEEERLNAEFIKISGTSELSRNSNVSSSTMSGTAIELLIEQDETRLSVTAENIRMAVKQMAKQILRLFKEFAGNQRIMRSAGDGKVVKLFYFKSSDLTSDDVVFDTENELTQTPAQKKTAVMEMLNSGLLSNENGVIDLRTKAKILDVLGYGSLDNAQDVAKLHRNKAEKENLDLKTGKVAVDFYDNHNIHIEEHVRKLLELDGDRLADETYKQNIVEHLNEHKLLKFKDIKGNVNE